MNETATQPEVIATPPAVITTIRRPIAIFGTTPTRMEGPIGDDSGWTRWTIGPGGKDHHNWDRLYEVHHVWPEDFKGYLGDLSRESREVWTLDPAPQLISAWRRTHKKSDEEFAKDIPGDWSSNRVIPVRQLEERFGRTWFSSSISWLFGHAIMEGATDIGLWGIDLEAGEEYLAQFYGCRFFIDLARNFGINVHLPTGCGLLREPRAYPDRYETNQALHMEKKAKFLQHHLSQMEPQYDGLRQEACRQEGRVLTLREMGASMDFIGPAEQKLLEFNAQIGQAAANIHSVRGQMDATNYYRRMYVYNSNDPEWMG